MINEKSIFIENGRLKRNCFIIVFILTFCFFITKLTYSVYGNKTLNLSFVIESYLLSSITLVFFISFLIRCANIKDDSYFLNKARLYNLSFEIIGAILLFICAVYFPIWKRASSNIFSSQFLVYGLLFITLTYSFIHMKIIKSYVNSSLIQYETKKFLKGILKRVLKMLVVFSILFIITIISSLALIDLDEINFYSIIKEFIILFIILATIYIFFSFIEKLIIMNLNIKEFQYQLLLQS